MNEAFCSSCGSFSVGPSVFEDHDDFICFCCIVAGHRPYSAALFE